jgi:hypothetical protein
MGDTNVSRKVRLWASAGSGGDKSVPKKGIGRVVWGVSTNASRVSQGTWGLDVRLRIGSPFVQFVLALF